MIQPLQTTTAETDLRVQLLQKINGRFVVPFLAQIEQQPDRLFLFYALVRDKNHLISWRSAWVLNHVSTLHPEWLLDKRPEMAEWVMDEHLYTGTRHQLLDILNNLPVEQPLNISLLNYLLDVMLDFRQKPSVLSLAMKLAHRICVTDADLHSEFICILQNTEWTYGCPAIRSVVRNLLKKEHTRKRKTTKKMKG